MDFGTGSALLGGGAGNALQEAMSRRQTGQGGVTGEVSPAAGGMQAPPPQGPMTPPPPQAGSQAGQPQPPVNAPTPQSLPDIHAMENQIILKALSSKLGSNSDIAEAGTIPPKPTNNG